ncbi:MAG: hypothetical protein LQ340_006832 [Diploschistes diacapsis]|nr:MAG: hypothetical protein LQ340_006832 [Diploschistes diacapsis]
MSKTIFISSQKQFESLLSSSQVVVTDCEFPPAATPAPTMLQTHERSVYADWCRPCKTIAPLYEQLSSQLSRPQKVAFTKVNVDSQPEIARKYGVTA